MTKLFAGFNIDQILNQELINNIRLVLINLHGSVVVGSRESVRQLGRLESRCVEADSSRGKHSRAKNMK